MMVYYCLEEVVFLSSKSMREAGEKSSSNCPVLTPHMKAIRKRAATEILAASKMKITLITK
jgi:hypothetical protein